MLDSNQAIFGNIQIIYKYMIFEMLYRPAIIRKVEKY